MARNVQEGTVRNRRSRVRSDAGNAMVVALLVLMLFTAAGVTFIAVTKSEKQIAGNQMASSQAMYAAEAGLSEAIARMSDAKDPSYLGSITPKAGWGCYVVEAAGASSTDPGLAQAQSDGLDNDGDNVVDNPGERYPEVLSAQAGLSKPIGYPYVLLRYKTQGGQLVRFGDHDGNSTTTLTENLQVGAPVLEATARGVQGNANRLVDVVAYRYPLVEANSALWAGAPLKVNGNAFFIDGHDHYMAAPYDTVTGSPPAPAIMTEGPTTDAGVAPYQADNVIGAGGDGSVAHSPSAYDFNRIWATVSSIADVTLPGGTTLSSTSAPLGTTDAPIISCVTGNLKIQGTWSGAGILVVNGNLTMGGGGQYNGIVVVLGDVSLAGGGPSDVARVVGSLIYQGTIIDDCSYGGSGRIYYSREAIDLAYFLSRYQLAWWHER